MMKNIILSALVMFLLAGCDISNIDKAQQEVACSEYGGVHKYVPRGFKVRCNYGNHVEWQGIAGPKVADALNEIEGGGNNMYSVSQEKHNALKKENERLKELLSEDLVAENAKLKMRIEDLELSLELAANDVKETYGLQSVSYETVSVNKIKADAIREAAAEVVRGVTNYDGSDVDVVNVDEIIDYADSLERGEL